MGLAFFPVFALSTATAYAVLSLADKKLSHYNERSKGMSSSIATTRTAADEILAAIAALTQQKAEPCPAYLAHYDYDFVQDGNDDDLVRFAFNAGSDRGSWQTLQWTVDAQLAILDLAVEYGDLRNATPGSRFASAALTLARAINGTNA